MVEKYTLNIGSGERTYEEYPVGSGFKCINYDERDLPGRTDLVGDVKKLPWEDNYFEYILASDIIEHFPIAMTSTILSEWRRVLKIGGLIEFRLPDLDALCKKYVNGQQDAKLTSWLLMGGQDYPGNYHYVVFDREWFSAILVTLGFEVLDVKDADNNFELVAKKI